MKLNPIMLALSLALTATGAVAQTVDLGPDATGIKRFMLYPHLQKGFDAMKQGNRLRALSEFEQARAIAPNNPVIAAYLADAYRRFGERARAEVLLREQLTRNPGNAQLKNARDDLRREMAASTTLTPSQQPAPPPTLALALTLESWPHAASSAHAAENLIRPKKAKTRTPIHRAQSVPPGYFSAEKAYKASAEGDFASALPAARDAVRQAPDNRAYGKLLVYVLAQNGAYEEAHAKAENLLVDAQADSNELLAQRRTIRQRLAFEHFEAANQALRGGDTMAAVREARKGVEYAPDLLAHHLQLISAQLAAGQIEDANQASSRAIDELPGEPALLILRGYTRQRLGQRVAAAADFDQAVSNKDLSPVEQQNFRLIASHAALSAGEPTRAMNLVGPLEAGNQGADLLRQVKSTTQSRSLYPNATTSPALAAPGVVCTGSLFTPSCEVWPGEEAVNPAQKVAESAYQAFSAHDYKVAAVKAGEAIDLSPTRPAYRLLLVNALASDGNLEQANQHASRFIATYGDDAEMLAARSGIRQRLGKTDLAKEDAITALNSDKLSLASEITALIQLDRKTQARERLLAAVNDGLFKSEPDMTVAYLAVQVGDDAGAMAAFNHAATRGTLPNSAKQDAAYAAGRLGRNDEAVNYFKQSIDVAEAGQPFLTPQQLFNTRREVADRSRTWGANVALTHRGISQTGLAATQPGASNDSLQAGAEVWWRPLGYRDGRLLELYAGLSETLSSKAGYPTGAESLQGALGVRVKPLTDINLVLALERRIALGSKTTSDWLPRIAYSWGTGTDLRVDAPNWMTATVYAEAGRFIKQQQTYATFEGQLGRSFRMDSVSPKLVVFPHVVLGADYNASFASGSKGAVGAGAGVNLRHWFNEDRYNAPRSYADVSLQYRARISGDDRAKGVFLRATLAY